MLIRQIWRRVFIGILTGMVLSACSGSNEQTETNESKTASSSSAAEVGTSEEAAVVRPEESEPLLYEGDLELPVNGATGYTSVLMDLKATADAGSETISELEAGTAFEVLKEELVIGGMSGPLLNQDGCSIFIVLSIFRMWSPPSSMTIPTRTHPSSLLPEKRFPGITGSGALRRESIQYAAGKSVRYRAGALQYVEENPFGAASSFGGGEYFGHL